MCLLFTALVNAGHAGQRAHPPEAEAPANPGKQVYVSNCAFCHGATARGGAQGGPDLTQSSLVKSDRNGQDLIAFLKVGRPEKGMPAFHLPADKLAAMTAFLHTMIQTAPRAESEPADVLVGDAAAGKAFFRGEGHCAQCHSEQGDLKGIGAKYPPAVLEGRLVLPLGDGGYPGFPSTQAPRIRASIVISEGKTLSGLITYLSDYAITILDATGKRHTFARHGNSPTITLTDPLQAHLDRQLMLTDRQMHDLTAYLASLR